MKTRPPIITILGHVDHGKTTLLDHIRQTNIAGQEAGGITQSIGAYEITHSDKKITFIDTPGHKAFSKMRSHGAEVADLAVLVVAADDGVQPQTEEAINHLQKAEVPFIVAINKIDLPTADVEKTKNQLAQAEVYLEGRGGDVSFQEISAEEGTGVEELLDLINLAAEIQELEYDPEDRGEAIIINSFKDPRRGPIAGIIAKNGRISNGDDIFTDTTEGTIRSLENFLGEEVENIEPSSPALVLGFSEVPKVGEKLKVGQKEKDEEESTGSEKDIDIDEDHYPVIIKSAEAASLDALEDLIERTSTKEAPLTVADSGVGDIHDGDVKLAFSTDSIILGFSVDVDESARRLAKSQGTRIITSSVIYDLEEGLQEYVKEIEGAKRRVVKILDTFGTDDGAQIIGGEVTEGYVKDKEPFEVSSGDRSLGTGKIINLQSQKKEVPKAKEGQEVGMKVKASADIQPGHKLIFKGK